MQKSESAKLAAKVVQEELVLIWQEVKDLFRSTESLVEEATKASIDAVESAIKLGHALNAAKAKAAHGNWEKEFEKNRPAGKGGKKLSIRYAQDLMQLANWQHKVDKAFLANCKSVRQAMILCGIIPEPTERKPRLLEAPVIDAKIVSEPDAKSDASAAGQAQKTPFDERPHITAGPTPETPQEATARRRRKNSSLSPRPPILNRAKIPTTGKQP